MMKTSIFTAIALLIAAMSVQADDTAADNTDRNDRDQSGTIMTPMDQSNSEEDVDQVAAIRRAIIAQDQISILGQNIKVIANHGAVLLRGPVQNADEKARIAETVSKVPGVISVDNRLEIKR